MKKALIQPSGHPTPTTQRRAIPSPSQSINKRVEPSSGGTSKAVAGSVRPHQRHSFNAGRTLVYGGSVKVEDAEDHSQWLNIEHQDGELQSLQSVALDSSRHKMMVDLVERQRNATRARALKQESVGNLNVSADGYSIYAPPVFERNNTTSTEGLSEITLESDEGASSDRTTTAIYMTDSGPTPPRLSGFAGPLDLRHLSDEDILRLEWTIRAEKENRMKYKRNQSAEINSTVDQIAVEARRGIRRSKSGGLESAFHSRKHINLNNENLNNSFSLLGLKEPNESVYLETEDPEVRNAFSTPTLTLVESTPCNTNIPVNPQLNSFQSSPSHSSRAISRGSGALAPNDKMFNPSSSAGTSQKSPMGLSCSISPTPSHLPVRSSSNSAVQFINSPIQTHHHVGVALSHSPLELSSIQTNLATTNSSLSGYGGYRPASGTGLLSLLHVSSSICNEENGCGGSTPYGGSSRARPTPLKMLEGSHTEGNVTTQSHSTVPTAFRSIEGDEETPVPINKPHGRTVRQNSISRDLVLSPSSAFDDISLGSAKSYNTINTLNTFNSSRSSRTNNNGSNRVGDLGSPTSTFSKRCSAASGNAPIASSTNNNIPKKGSSNETPKKNKKN